MKRLGILLVVLLLFGCARGGGQVVVKNAPIYLPDPPERIAVEEPDKEQRADTYYVKPPTILKGKQKFDAPEGGAIVWDSKAWRAVNYGLTEWPRWGDRVLSIAEDHNRKAISAPAAQKKSWYEIWK